MAPANSSGGGDLVSERANEPAVARGGQYMGFPEKFNRYYTDPAWKPSKTVYVSPDGSGDGATRDTPMSAQAAIAAARPGTQIHFLRGNYQGCFEFSKENSGTYDEPVVALRRAQRGQVDRRLDELLQDRPADLLQLRGRRLRRRRWLRADRRQLRRARGRRGYRREPALARHRGAELQRPRPGVATRSSPASPTGPCGRATSALARRKSDGHGIYLSNGSDWNIVRFNETYGNVSSDFQINADPVSTCKEAGIPFNDPRCDAYAGKGEGGQGASDYFLVDGNYFHHSDVGPNFTSVRRSIVRNNIFGPQARHNVTFWQETDNPKLGSSDNKIVHNLFITTGRHGVKFENNSTRNEFANNVLLGVQMNGGDVTANPSALLMEVDDTVGDNVYRANLYVSGKIEGRTPTRQETARADFSPSWFAKFPTALNHDPNDFKPTAEAPFLGMGDASPDAPADRNGTGRSGEVDLGPIELPLILAATDRGCGVLAPQLGGR